MKKLFILALVALMALGSAAMAEVGMPNPWTETTAEGVMETVGLEFGLPEGATNVSYRVLEGEHLAEMTFTWYDLEYTARIKSADAFEDISGLYYDWADELPCVIGRCDGVCRRAITDEGMTDVCLWYDALPGLMYSVSASDADLDGFDIQAAAEQVYLPMQAE